MRLLYSVLFLVFAFQLRADIPRMDILEMKFRGGIYYAQIFTAHLELKEGCVFDRHSREYLYEEEDFIKKNLSKDGVDLYEEMFMLPLKKLYPKRNHFDYFSGELPITKRRMHLTSEGYLDSMEFVKVHIGQTAGFTSTRTLSYKDMDWIRDYEMEKIASLKDGELCMMDLFAIKGNITPNEAQQIKSRLVKGFQNRLKDKPIEMEDPYDVLDELLDRHIFMIGFCSC